MHLGSTKHLETHITLWSQFHAYVLGSVIGIRWGKITPSSGMGNSGLKQIVREYLTYAAGEDKWKKRGILDAMRDRSAGTIKDDARYAFPSLFPRGKRAQSLGVPLELSNEEVSFDLSLIEAWKERVRVIKKEIAMNENAIVEQDVDTSSRATVNFHLPQGVNASSITLDNYKEVTGKRFRMTKDQKARGLTREQAFAESRGLVNQTGGSDE